MFVANDVMELFFAVLDVSFNNGHYTIIIKRQFLYINLWRSDQTAVLYWTVTQM